MWHVWGQEWCIQGFGDGERPLRRFTVGGRILLKWTIKKWNGET